MKLYDLEIEGISNTIKDYSVENFITSYSRKLIGLKPNKDKYLIETIVDRLVMWYQENILTIMNSRFVQNKEEHQKSYRLLTELQSLLSEYKVG